MQPRSEGQTAKDLHDRREAAKDAEKRRGQIVCECHQGPLRLRVGVTSFFNQCSWKWIKNKKKLRPSRLSRSAKAPTFYEVEEDKEGDEVKPKWTVR